MAGTDPDVSDLTNYLVGLKNMASIIEPIAGTEDSSKLDECDLMLSSLINLAHDARRWIMDEHYARNKAKCVTTRIRSRPPAPTIDDLLD